MQNPHSLLCLVVYVVGCGSRKIEDTPAPSSHKILAPILSLRIFRQNHETKNKFSKKYVSDMGYEHVEGHLELFHLDSGSFHADDNNHLFSYFTSGERCNEGVKTDRHSFWSSEEGQFSGLRSPLHTGGCGHFQPPR